MGPALENYTVALNQLYSFAKNTPAITKNNSESLQDLSKREEDALKRFQQTFVDSDSKGCSKT